MNREILFRAKRKEWKDLPKEEWWVEGHHLSIDKKEYIIHSAETNCMDGENTDLYATEWYEVDVETICQWTGLTDKNGREIFEGDIVLFTDNIKIKGTTSHTSKVEWNTEIGGFVFHAECIGYCNVNPSQIKKYEVEVIGNIFDNPELLEEG